MLSAKLFYTLFGANEVLTAVKLLIAPCDIIRHTYGECATPVTIKFCRTAGIARICLGAVFLSPLAFDNCVPLVVLVFVLFNVLSAINNAHLKSAKKMVAYRLLMLLLGILAGYTLANPD